MNGGQGGPHTGASAVLLASGDTRLSANQVCWPAQFEMERQLVRAFQRLGLDVVRGHAVDDVEGHGFISSQRMGMDVFNAIDPGSRVIVAEAVWQYSHHVLAGLRSHRGPILTVANWSGRWPGLVGLLNLNASLTKAGVPYSTLWSEDFEDDFFVSGATRWLETGRVEHDVSHVRDFDVAEASPEAVRAGTEVARAIDRRKAILGVFDEGCMGMYNAIIDDEMLNPMGIYKERLSQSALVAEMRLVGDDEARGVREWLERRGMRFDTGPDEGEDLTDGQIHEQCRMYVAAVRMAHRFGCDAIGIQYQQGLKDMVPASDLVEGLLNCTDRPPVKGAAGETLYPGEALPHFNEVEEGAGVDALVPNRVWTSLGFETSTTLHDLRWGQSYRGPELDAFVWVFQISGAAPASHFVDGYAGAVGYRQPPMYFPLGGSTLSGVSRPGPIVWSRVYVMEGRLHADLGRGTAVELPAAETRRRLAETTPQWPIMHAVLHGVSRDQMMAQHKSNHVQVAYAPTDADADTALEAKAAAFQAMGTAVHLCGTTRSS
jgi:hypothetical protein